MYDSHNLGRVLVEGNFETIKKYDHPFLKNISSEEAEEKEKKTEKVKFDAKDGERVQEKNLETKKEGEIGWRNFWNYIRASDTVYLFFIWVIVKIGAVALFMLSDVQFSQIGDTAEKDRLIKRRV